MDFPFIDKEGEASFYIHGSKKSEEKKGINKHQKSNVKLANVYLILY